MNSKNKGQGALELLLLAGGAVAIAAIVIFLALGSTKSAGDDETLRLIQVASECSGACANVNACDDFDDRVECENECKSQAQADQSINSGDYKWNCDDSVWEER